MRDNLKKRLYTALIIYPLLVLITIYSNEMVIRLTLNIIISYQLLNYQKCAFIVVHLIVRKDIIFL